MNTTMPPSTTTERPRLMRSRDDRMVAGIAGGIARTYGFDATLVRLAIVVVSLLTAGTGVIAYLVAWIVIPDDDGTVIAEDFKTFPRHFDRHNRRERRHMWIGILLLAAGIVVTLDRLHFGRFGHFIWPIALIAAGATMLLLRHDNGHVGLPRPPTPPAPPAPPAPFPFGHSTQAPPTPPASEPGSSGSDAGADGTDDGDEEAGEAGEGEAAATTSAYTATAPWPQGPWPGAPWPDMHRHHHYRHHRRSILARLTWSVLLLLVGGAWLIDLTGAASVDAAIVVDLALAVVGGALILGAWFGRARGLLGLAIPLTVFATILAILSVPLRGGIGQRIVAVSSTRELKSRYELAIGHLSLDLRHLTIDRDTSLRVTDAMGFVEITVPDDLRVVIDGKADAGNLQLVGHRDVSGVDAHSRVVSGPRTGPTLTINAHVGFGAVAIHRANRTVEVVP